MVVTSMNDLIYLVITLGFFALGAGYAQLCGKL